MTRRAASFEMRFSFGKAFPDLRVDLLEIQQPAIEVGYMPRWRRLNRKAPNSAVHISAAEKHGVSQGHSLERAFLFHASNFISAYEDFAKGKISLCGANCITVKLILMRHLRPKNENPEGCLIFSLSEIQKVPAWI